MVEFGRDIRLHVLDAKFPKYATVTVSGEDPESTTEELKYVPELYTINVDGQCRECGMELREDYVCCPLCGSRIVAHTECGDLDE